jgi:undecaprenyl-diphosphatase
MDHEFWEAIILGAVQGVTEFLPISSDGHLVVTQALLKTAGLASATERDHLHFDVVLHVGTLLAIVLVFWRELLALVTHPRRAGLVVLASIPAAVVGLTVKNHIEKAFQSPLMAGVGFLVTALFLFLGHRAGSILARFGREPRSLEKITAGDAMLIGGAQALAILPGVSRSGSTIATGVLLGISREAAAVFSFLMAVPVIGGAILLIAKDIAQGEGKIGRWDVAAVGTVVSFLVGVVALKWLLRVLSRGGLIGFSVYCLVAGIAVIAWQLAVRPG